MNIFLLNTLKISAKDDLGNSSGIKTFKYTVDDCDIVIENVTKTAEEYNKLIEIEDVKKVDYMYCWWDTETTYNDGEKFNTVPTIVGQKESRKYIKELDYKIESVPR